MLFTTLMKTISSEILFQKEVSNNFLKLLANQKLMEFKREAGIIEELPIRFKGKGEVKGFVFQQVYFHNVPDDEEPFYVYIVDGNYYEVFDRVIKGNKVYYPKSEDFGDIAWTFNSVNNLINFVHCHYGINLTKEQLIMPNI